MDLPTTRDEPGAAMSDDDQYKDCPNCIYGPEFIDDGIPHRMISFMCKACREKSEKALDFLFSHKLLQSPPAGDA